MYTEAHSPACVENEHQYWVLIIFYVWMCMLIQVQIHTYVLCMQGPEVTTKHHLP